MSLKHRKKPTSDADLVEQTNETDVVEKARGIFKSDKALLALLVAFRLINAALCSTWFVADEYWQSLEVAHRMVFGYLFSEHGLRVNCTILCVRACVYVCVCMCVCVCYVYVYVWCVCVVWQPMNPRCSAALSLTVSHVWLPHVGMEEGSAWLHTPPCVCGSVQTAGHARIGQSLDHCKEELSL